MRWIEHKYMVALNWTSDPYFLLDIEGVGMAREFILKDYYKLNYSSLWYLCFISTSVNNIYKVALYSKF